MQEHKTINLKHRLIGLIVLLSLAIIIIPIIFRPDERLKQQFEVPPIPPLPAEISQQLSRHNTRPRAPKRPPMPQPQAVPVDQYNAAAMKNIAVKTLIKPQKTARKPNNPVYDQSYLVQIASFQRYDNARKLEKKLLFKGYPVFIEKVRTLSGQTFRVRIGPYLKYGQALAVQKKANQQFHLRANIVVNKIEAKP